MDSDLFSRAELLSGELNRSRRAARLLAAIEARCRYLREESRQVVQAYFIAGDGNFQRRYCLDEVDSLVPPPGDSLHLQHLEHFSLQWQSLVPVDPELRARLMADAQAVMLYSKVVSPAVVRAARRLNGQVFAWKVDDPAHIRRLQAMGVAAITSNYPERVVANSFH